MGKTIPDLSCKRCGSKEVPIVLICNKCGDQIYSTVSSIEFRADGTCYELEMDECGPINTGHLLKCSKCRSIYFEWNENELCDYCHYVYTTLMED